MAAWDGASAILAVGSVALDSVETPERSVHRVIGGSAVFFSAAASLLAPVGVVGVVGDEYPLHRLDFLKERGTDLDGIVQRPGESFFWAGRYRGARLRIRETTATRLGVFGDFRPVVPPAWRGSEIVFLGNIDPVLQRGVLDQVAAPRLVAADTMNYWIERAPEALARVLARLDVLLVNDEEALQLSGEADLDAAAARILAMGPGVAVVKRGEEGAIVFGPGWSESVGIHAVDRVVDPTGAGDAFAGGFLGFLAGVAADSGGRASLSRRALRAAARHGAAAGALAVEDFSVGRPETATQSELRGRARAVPAGRLGHPLSLGAE